MSQPSYNPLENVVLAQCPECNSRTSFDTRGHSNSQLGAVIINRQHGFNNGSYSRVLWQFFRCNSCSRGAVAKIHDNGQSATAVLETFLPSAVQQSPLPAGVPKDIQTEFREAELVAAHGAFRAASALLRSVLEKTLTKNGYDEVEATNEKGVTFKTKSLKHRIDTAADDGVITQARKRRVHDNIRVLGNDILHDDWREVTPGEYEDAHLYSQRILEDFYDDRRTVEGVLIAKERIPSPPAASGS
jgi:hypothetical protein